MNKEPRTFPLPPKPRDGPFQGHGPSATWDRWNIAEAGERAGAALSFAEVDKAYRSQPEAEPGQDFFAAAVQEAGAAWANDLAQIIAPYASVNFERGERQGRLGVSVWYGLGDAYHQLDEPGQYAPGPKDAALISCIVDKIESHDAATPGAVREGIEAFRQSQGMEPRDPHQVRGVAEEVGEMVIAYDPALGLVRATFPEAEDQAPATDRDPTQAEKIALDVGDVLASVDLPLDPALFPVLVDTITEAARAVADYPADREAAERDRAQIADLRDRGGRDAEDGPTEWTPDEQAEQYELMQWQRFNAQERAGAEEKATDRDESHHAMTGEDVRASLRARAQAATEAARNEPTMTRKPRGPGLTM